MTKKYMERSRRREARKTAVEWREVGARRGKANSCLPNTVVVAAWPPTPTATSEDKRGAAKKEVP